MAFRFTHLFGDDDGETWFAEVELATSAPTESATVSTLAIPAVRLTYAEYPPEESEIMPGLHPTPMRHFISPLRGGFEVTTSRGDARVFGVGDWILFDDRETKGHLTKGVGTESRINVIVAVAEDWELPST